MSFLLQRASGRSLTLTQISGSALRIGRGTNQELRSENPAVALEHAIIESDAAGYLITDKGSITGTYVNRKPVETARLTKGDVIEIGDLRVEVQIADPAKPLFLRVATVRTAAAAQFEEEEEQAAVAAPGARVVKAKKFDYAGAYRLQRPWLTKLTVTALLLIVALAIVGEVIRPEKQTLFMPGGLSSAHARARDAQGRSVAGDCEACHSPWKSVSSAKCERCHAQGPHAQTVAAAPPEPDCFSCHAEHRGEAKLAAAADTTCAGCHGKLTPPVTAFGEKHPEITVPRDPNTLRFNHKFHLNPKGVFNATGRREVLACTNCHAGAEPSTADFEQHCQRCHRLTFDARFPNDEMPHGGASDVAYGFVIAAYSNDRNILGKSPSEVRRILSARKTVAVDQRAVIAAEQVLNKKCTVCHDVVRRGARLAAIPPVIPTVWMDGAKFTHARHRTVACETCHGAARTSVATSDVLMPVRANCTNCHAAGARQTQAASACVTCHEYHQSPRKPVMTASLAQAGVGGLGGGGRMLQGILLAVIVILLLVVLVPVGIALFQRLRPERAAAPPAAAPRAKPAPPPARSATPDMSTDRVPRQSSAQPPDIKPPAPAPVVEATRVPVPEVKTDAPMGTEMVQWNGLLHCTSGPLEGQRFVIEDDGFYIGRDPALAKIVIPDSRVSKRHVRILPRDGKVWAIDEGSTNGTFLKDQRITEVQLKRGDALVLGDNAATFVYQI